jgi:hypothetical protein
MSTKPCSITQGAPWNRSSSKICAEDSPPVRWSIENSRRTWAGFHDRGQACASDKRAIRASIRNALIPNRRLSKESEAIRTAQRVKPASHRPKGATMHSCSRCDLKRSVCLCLFAQPLFVLGLTTSGQSQNPVTTSTRALVHSKGGELERPSQGRVQRFKVRFQPHICHNVLGWLQSSPLLKAWPYLALTFFLSAQYSFMRAAILAFAAALILRPCGLG